MADLGVSIGGIRLANPVMAASGTFGYGEEFSRLMDIKGLGAIITKTITLNLKQGNLPPRITETSAGMLNAIGLENPGVSEFIRDKLPFLRALRIPVIVSIAGENTKEYCRLAERLTDAAGIAALEINVSCPNISHWSPVTGLQSPVKIKDRRQATGDRRLLIGQDRKATYKLVKAVRKRSKITLITKLSPNVTDIVSLAKAARDAGSDALSLVNSFKGMAVDIDTRRPKLGNITGGLSGPAIKPLALGMVFEVAKNIDIPVIGMGGIMNTDDAIEFIIAGATAVAVGTANFVNPRAGLEIIQGIRDFIKDKGIKNIEELRGSIKYE